MPDKTATELGEAMIKAQASIHRVPAGWPLSAALAEFVHHIERWAQHPKHRNWDLIDEIDRMVIKFESYNQPGGEK